MKKGDTIYYGEQMNDDFGNIGHNNKPLKPDFAYVHKNIFYRFLSAVLFYGLAFPVLFLTAKIFLGVKIHGRENLKELKKNEGFFVFSNHTHYFDAFLMHVFIGFPKRTYVLSHPNAVNIPFIGHLVMMLGCLPVPQKEDFENYKKMLRAMRARVNEGGVIAVYPEGTLWPYYNGLRPFPKSSVKYAVMYKKPIVVCAETYRKPKGIFRKNRMDITVSEVYRYDETQTDRENIDRLYKNVLSFLEEHVLTETNESYYDYRLKSEK